MAKYKTKSDYTILKKLHERTEKGDIFEHDIMTINPMEDLFTEGQDIIVSDSNFKFSIRTDEDTSKKHTKNSWILTPSGNSEWTLNDIDSSPISSESEVRVKPNYTSIKDFAYYGSAIDMVRATVNHVILYFPAELYFSGIKFSDYLGILSGSSLDSYYVIPNKYDINVDVDYIDENKLDNPYRYLCLYGNSYDVYKNGEYQSSGVTKGEFHEEKRCGDGEIGSVTITGQNFRADLIEYVYKGEKYLLYKNQNLNGYSIRPNEVIVNEYFNTIDDFELVLLNRETKPKYKAIFETPYETDEGNRYSMVSYIWPSMNEWNPLVEGFEYEAYINSLIDLCIFHDEVDSNIIWRMLTHEAIKNLDWTFFRENGDEMEDISKIDSSKIEAMLQLYGRQFDGLKRYIDSIKYANNITYDEKNNVPDYLLTDAVEIGGFEAILPNPTAKTDVTSDALYDSMSEGYSEVDANISFMRNLKINEHYLNSLKGTRQGIEAILGLLGVRNGEYEIKEYVAVANGNDEYCEFSSSTGFSLEDIYPRAEGVKYPSAKDVAFINLNKSDATYDDYNTLFDGIPVKAFRKMTGVNPEDEPTYYAILWYENGKQYDGNWYFQSKGGWAKTKEKEISTDLTSATTLEYDKIYGETETYLKIVDTISEMLNCFSNEVYSGMVCYVNNINDIDKYVSGITGESQYFILSGEEINKISEDGWVNIPKEEIENLSSDNAKKVVYLETITELTEGNNPHTGKGLYDDGREYLDYMNQIFKYQSELGDDGLIGLSLKDKSVVSGYTFGIGEEKIEDNRKCDYYFNPNSAVTSSSTGIYMSGLTLVDSEQTYAVNPEGGEIDAEPAANSVINLKNMKLIFQPFPEGNEGLTEPWHNYVSNVVMEYVKQMIPSTTIFEWSFSGEEVEYYLRFPGSTSTSKTVEVEHNASSTNVSIETNAPSLSTSKSGIVTDVVTGSSSMNIKFTENPGYSQRTGTAEVSYGGSALTVTVKQKPKPEGTWNWTGGGTDASSSYTYNSQSSLSFGATTTYEGVSYYITGGDGWIRNISINGNGTQVTIGSIDENTGEGQRQCTYNICCSGSTVSARTLGRLTIVQAGKPAEKFFMWNNGSTAITTDNVSYDGATLTSGYSTNYESITFECDKTWCAVSNTSENVTATASQNTDTGNTRTAVVSAKNGSTVVGTWTITQQKKPEDKYLWIVTTGQTAATIDNVTSASSSQEVTVITNYTQEELNSISKMSSGFIDNVYLTTSKLKFDVQENSAGNDRREGSVEIGSLVKVTVKQNAGEEFKVYLKVNGSTSPADIAWDTTSFTITTQPNVKTQQYTITVSGTSFTSTTGDYTGTYTCGSNTGSIRNFVVECGGESVTIRQEGKPVPTGREIVITGSAPWWVKFNNTIVDEQSIDFTLSISGAENHLTGDAHGFERGDDYQFSLLPDAGHGITFRTTNMEEYYQEIRLTIESGNRRCAINPVNGSNPHSFSGGEIGGGSSGYETTGTIRIPAGTTDISLSLDETKWQTSDI